MIADSPKAQIPYPSTVAEVSATSPLGFIEPPRFGPKRIVLIMLLLYSLAGGALGIVATWHDYVETLRQSEVVTQDIARLLEEHVKRTLDTGDLVLLRTIDKIEERGVAALAGSTVDWVAIHNMAKALPQIGVLYISDADGNIRLASTRFAADFHNISGRDYFNPLKYGENESYIGQVISDPETKTYSFTMARRLNDKHNNFIGVVAVTIETEYLKKFYKDINLGINPGLGVYKMDGSILVREPLDEKDIGRNMSRNPVYVTYLPHAPIGSYRGKSAYDGIVRVVSYRQVEEPPLLVWVSVAETEALAAWWMRLYRNAALTLGGLVVTCTLAWLAWRGLRREEYIRNNLQAISEDLYNTNLKLRQSNADLEQFAYIASHDLREPLRVVSSYAQLLRHKYQGRLDRTADESVYYITEGIRRMYSLIDELLAYSRISNDEIPLTPIHAAEAVQQALDGLKEALARPNVVVEVEAMPVILANKAQLARVFHNLIDNAIKFQKPDAPVKVTIGAVYRDKFWHIFVRDNGIGIDPAYFDQIFLIFKRLHTRAHYVGNGIGLAICKRILERTGSRIWVESTPGGGSTFWFTAQPAPETAGMPYMAGLTAAMDGGDKG